MKGYLQSDLSQKIHMEDKNGDELLEVSHFSHSVAKQYVLGYARRFPILSCAASYLKIQMV